MMSLNSFSEIFLLNKKLRYKQMEIFHQGFQYTLLNLSDVIECTFLLQFLYNILWQINV